VLNISCLLGLKSARPHVFVGPCHDFEELWEVRGSLVESDVRIVGNNQRLVLHTPHRTVRYDMRTVQAYARSVRYYTRMVRAC
jgi:hypothetical protein